MPTDFVIETPTKPPRKSRAWPPDLLALRRFARAMEKTEPHIREANIRWLVDYFDVKTGRL